MKKTFAFVLILALLLPLSSFASDSADIDLSGLSFDELIALREQLNLAIWNSQEWHDVTVPAGVWEIGKDIPEGHWTIRLAADDILASFAYTDLLDEFGKDVGYGWKGVHGALCNKKNRDGSLKWPEYSEEIDIDMKSGMYFINKAPFSFTTYVGKPDLGFH